MEMPTSTLNCNAKFRLVFISEWIENVEMLKENRTAMQRTEWNNSYSWIPILLKLF